MACIKSIVAGLLALVIVFGSLVATVVIIAWRFLGGISGVGVASPRGHIITSVFWLLIAIATFAAGFFWEFRSLTK